MPSIEMLKHLPQNKQDMYLNYYNIDFDSLGCPVKKTRNGTYAFHPLIAAYLVLDFVRAYDRDQQECRLACALDIARSALAHAERLQDALVFRYKAEDGLSYVPGTFYSALSQAWFMHSLCELRRYSDDFDDAIAQIFRSLLIPIGEGGVLVSKSYGWIVEEYPHWPHLYTLNGWLTVLQFILQHKNTLSKLGLDPTSFLDNNARAVKHLIPLYDAGFCLNSRYQLAGFSRIRLVISERTEVNVHAFSVEIPNEGVFCGKLFKQRNRWSNYLERLEKKCLQFNIILSLISFPEPNKFSVTLEASASCRIQVLVAKGDYDSQSTGMPTQRWDKIATFDVPSKGRHSFVCDIPFDDENLFAYPTNFKKLIGGRFYNVYHFTHIQGCAELYRYSGHRLFRDYCEKFLRYYEEWPKLNLPDNHELSRHVAESGHFASDIRRILASVDLAVGVPKESI